MLTVANSTDKVRESDACQIVATDLKNNYVIGDNPSIKKVSIVETAEILPLCDYKNGRRSVVYLSGMSGSGKSSFALSMISNSIINEPRVCQIFIVTREPVESDANYSKRLYDRPSLKELAEKGVNIINLSIMDIITGDMTNSFLHDIPEDVVTFVLLDDMDSIIDRTEKKMYKEFEHMLLTRARKFRVNVFICNHRAMDHENTKHILGELTAIWIPLRSKISYNFKVFLEKHCDLKFIAGLKIDKFIEKYKEKNRWAYINIDSSMGSRWLITQSSIVEDV